MKNVSYNYHARSRTCQSLLLLPQKMLLFDVNKRISARQALSHNYFKEYELYPHELYPPVYEATIRPKVIVNGATNESKQASAERAASPMQESSSTNSSSSGDSEPDK